MPFKHIIDETKNIAVLKAVGEVSVTDIVTEIQAAIKTKRGEGITRRLLDMTDIEFTYNIDAAAKILKMLKVSAGELGSKRIAILFSEIPDSFDLNKVKPLMNTPNLEIEIFTDRAQALEFINKPSG